MSFKSCAAIYRAIESSQGIFKYNGTRLTLIDPKSRPFRSMDREEIDEFLESLIRMAGLFVTRTAAPGGIDSCSSKFTTFYTSEGVKSREFPIVFGYAYSAAEEIQVSEIKREIQRVLSGSEVVRLWNGSGFVSIDGITRRGGSREKADAALLLGHHQVMSLSLKNLKSGLASQMQGWSGLSGFSGKLEVISFADAAHRSGASRAWRPILDPELRRAACWGSKHDTVDTIVAGSGLRLVDFEEGHALTADRLGGVWHASIGEMPGDGFEPVLFCRPSKNHIMMTSGGPIKGIRAMVAPLAVATSVRGSIRV